MAHVTQQFDPPPVAFPWIGITDLERDRSNTPRAEVRFFLSEEDVVAEGAGDTTRIRVALDLPRNFSYALAELFVSISAKVSGEANTYETSGIMIYKNNPLAGVAPFRIFAGMEQASFTDLSGKPRRTYQLTRAPIMIAIPDEVGALSADLDFDCYTDATLAATLTVFARFYQYDIAQTYDAAVNTPILTR